MTSWHENCGSDVEPLAELTGSGPIPKLRTPRPATETRDGPTRIQGAAKGDRQKEFDHFFRFQDSFGHFLVTFSDASVTFFVTNFHENYRSPPQTEFLKFWRVTIRGGTTLREALRENVPLSGLCGGLSEGSAGSRGSAGVRGIFGGFSGVVTLCLRPSRTVG